MNGSKLFWKLFLTCISIMTVGMLALALMVAAPSDNPGNALAKFTIVSLLAGAGMYWTAKRIVGPIGELTNAAQQLSRGEEITQMSFDRDDELGTLADSLRSMNKQIRAREGEVRETAELLSTVLTGLKEGVLAVDNESRVLFANPAARSILAIPNDQFIGRPLADITRNPMLRLAVTRAMMDNPNTNDDEAPLQMISESSPNRAYMLIASRLGGTPVPGVVIGFQDVSEIRELERMRQEFVSNVSHELKTPLSNIKAYAETLRGGAIDDAKVSREFLTCIEKQSDRLSDLILDMIRLARIESGQQGFDITSVSIAEVIDVAFHRNEAIAKERGVSLHCDNELPDYFVRADEEGLQQIFDNLIDNAVKYSKQSGNVLVEWRTNDENDLIVSVKDDGLGIKPEDQKRVFERFYRVDKARSSELGSTGLGLSIVKHMARAFGGGVSLESEYGYGTTFHVRLPQA